MDDEQSLQSLPPEQQTADEEGAREATAGDVPAQAEPEAEAGAALGATGETETGTDTETGATETAAEAEAEVAAAADAQSQSNDGLPRGSIAAVGEKLGQRVAHISETAGDKVAHVGELAGERVAHAGEAAGQKVILASEAAEGTVAEAQTRAVQAKKRMAEQVGHLTRRVRSSTPEPVREKGARVAEVVRKNPGKIAGSALVGLMAVVRRRGRNSDKTD